MATAIVTKYLPATDHRGSRIVASNDQGRVTVAYDYDATTSRGVHRRALIEHTRKYGSALPGQWVGQWLNARSMVWVYVTEDIKVEGLDLVG